MIEWIQPALGYASATLVAIIALGFGAMFLFFSGASALVLGQFICFAATPRLAAVAVGTATALFALLGAAVDPIFYGWAVAQVLFSALGSVLYRVSGNPWVRRAYGALLLSCGLTYVVSLALPDGARIGDYALIAARAILLLPAFGLAPLVVLGLAEHVRQRPVEWF